MKKNIFLFLGLLLGLYQYTNAQRGEAGRFSATAIAGLNFSQIDGDAAAGYSKIGLHLGAKAEILFSQRFSVGFELLYDQKGSFSRNIGNDLNYNLHFASIPVEFNLHEWFVEDQQGRTYSRVNFCGGFMYNQIVAGTVNIGGVDITEREFEEMRRVSVMFRVGVQAFFTRNIGVGVHWSRSLYNMKPRSSGLFVMHAWTGRLLYRF